jgi:quercetin dioxygenase-like cupin family protein
MIARIELKKGCIIPLHSHANEQIAFITQGVMRLALGEEGSTTDYLLHPGDLLVIPANVPHTAEVLEDCIDFDIFAPPRQDWINKEDSYLRG